MFTQNWRQYWGLKEDAFACEDADKDLILSAVDPAAVHSGFDRIFGNPKVPAPGIVFGEKGSGKSGLRLMMRRWIERHNKRSADERVFCIEYIDFDSGIENVQQLLHPRGGEKAARKVLEQWEISDHLDSILSLGVTQLVDDLTESGESPTDATPKQRTDLLLLTSLYYNSPKRSVTEAVRAMRGLLKLGNVRSGGLWTARIIASAVAIAVGLLPHFVDAEGLGPTGLWHAIGGAGLAAIWLWTLLGWITINSTSSRAARSVRVLPRDPALVRSVLLGVKPKDRKDYVMPVAVDAATRYEMLDHFLGILRRVGYTGCYVLMDRIDEPSLLSGSDDRMRSFLEKILDIKLLQYPGLALKLFLPIEMETIYRNASPEELKRMRLDKSNLIPELKWTGQELYEISNQRLRACLEPDSKIKDLSDLFAEDVDMAHLRDTLHALGTPRYTFGFLSALFLEHVRELPNELAGDDPRWKCPLAHFDVVRAAWIDRTGVLRRSLN